MRKLIAVVGATGAQGGGLVRAVLADSGGRYRLRAIMRKPESAAARALEERGVEIVAADIGEMESLVEAFRGADCAFCTTNLSEYLAPEMEMSQAHSLAHATQRAGVGHVIWCTLEDTRRLVPLEDDRMPTLQGQYKVPHFDAKGASDHFFSEGAVPTTFLRTAFFWNNLINFGMGPRRNASGKLEFTLPMADKKLAGIAAEDVGGCAYGIFKRGHELIGQTVSVAGEHLTGAQMAAQLSRALGQDVAYNYVPPEVFRTLPIPAAQDLANMFQYQRDFEREFCAARDLAFSRALNPQLQTFEVWLDRNRRRIPIPT